MDKDEIEKIKQYYSITEEDFQEMYMKAREVVFRNHTSEKGQPTAVFIGGQPGAGKSALVIKTKRDFIKKNKDILIFDLDLYRGLYKNSIEIAKKYPDLYSEITGKTSGRIMEKLSTEAIQNGFSFIIEGTMGKPIFTLNVLEKYGEKYNILAKVLAVCKEESLLSIFERYIEMKREMGIGRMTAIENHNCKYSNFINVVNTLEPKGIEVEVYERSDDIVNPTLTYKTSSKNNIYSSPYEAIIIGRKNSSRKCKENALQRLKRIKSDITSIGEEDKYKKQIEDLTAIIEKANERERD